jgi:hypothetical protein
MVADKYFLTNILARVARAVIIGVYAKKTG